MIKFAGTHDHRLTIGLGLSRANCERLMMGKPIAFNLQDMNPKFPDLTIMLLGGETEEAIKDELVKAGKITPQTTIKEIRHGEI